MNPFLHGHKTRKSTDRVTPRLVDALFEQVGELQLVVAELKERVTALESRKTGSLDDLRQRVESFSLIETPIEGTLEARSFPGPGADAMLGIIQESEDKGRERWEDERERDRHERDHYDDYGRLIHQDDDCSGDSEPMGMG